MPANESPSQSLLEISGLRISFPSAVGLTEVTHGTDVSVTVGEVVALVGESGSGKTVTAMSIPRLLPAGASMAGSIRFDGEELTTASDERIRQLRGSQISVVFQEPMTALNPVYTIGRQLTRAIRLHDDCTSAEARIRAIELLRQVDLPNPEQMLARFPHQISGGQRQRALIAMAISGRPRLLIADEPTTALDVTVQAGILALLRQLGARHGMAVLIITHDMGVVADIADRVVVMHNGSVVEHGTADEVFYRPTDDYTRSLLAAVPSITTVDIPVIEPERPRAEPVVELTDLGVQYPGGCGFGRPRFDALTEVTFDVMPGEIVGLVGESGSGKSTLGRAVLGLTRITSGSASVVGVDVTKAGRAELRQLRRHTSVVFQDPGSSLNPRATIGQSITDPLKWTGIERRRSALAARAGELLEQVRLPSSWADRYPHELSGGQRQRIGIARAIATRPRVLVADEPTSALDVSVQATVLDLLLELQSELGFSCIFISHDLAVVEKIANRVVVLQAGRVVEVDSAAQVLRAPREEYTRKLLSAVLVPDPHAQRERRLSLTNAQSRPTG
ncbi:ABC transporter ATP-binding protein [Gryllotalpicola koreensis]|uniref:ABC transporter ATP-binding protein n=1 Tax=Gryllotalpicola koreensis TaxID=993086 RepID=A0ABP8A9T9_9MICO